MGNVMFDTGLQKFVNQVNRIPKLTAVEEKRLARRWRDYRDAGAAHRIVCSHLGYVVAIASKYRRYQLPMSELVAEGNLGLLRALDKFDPERDIRFVTYAAFWVRSQIVTHVLRNWSIAQTGSAPLRSKLFFKLRRERARALARFGESPEFEEELQRRTGIARERLRVMLARLDAHDVSLDEPVSDSADAGARLDSLESSEPLSDERLTREQSTTLSRSLVQSALRVLDRRELFIVENRMLASDDDELSLAELGRRLGISRERARQLEGRAKQKLRAQLVKQFETAGVNPSELVFAA